MLKALLTLWRSGVLAILWPLIQDWTTQVGKEILEEAKAAAEEFLRQSFTPNGWSDEEITVFVARRLEEAEADGRITWDEAIVARAMPVIIRWARANAGRLVKGVKRGV
jgi:hypothetical protein